jgi:hypothetical protein
MLIRTGEIIMGKKSLARVCVLSLLMLTVSMVPAIAQAQVIDQNQPSGPNYMAAFSQTDLAQSFIPGMVDSVGAGILLEPGIGTTDTVTIQLWTDLPTAGGATMLAQGSVIGTAGSWVDVSWPTVTLTLGQTYYLVFVGNTTLGISGDTANPYPNGQVYANPGFQPFPTFDYAFRTWSGLAAANVPDTSPAGILVLSLLIATAGWVMVRRFII